MQDCRQISFLAEALLRKSSQLSLFHSNRASVENEPAIIYARHAAFGEFSWSKVAAGFAGFAARLTRPGNGSSAVECNKRQRITPEG
jgi:hypothetical protein